MTLSIQDVSASIKKNHILEQINLEVKSGEMVALLGESGSGKTTLIKAVTGILKVNQGDIKLHGESVLKLPPNKRRVSVVFQEHRLFPHLTVEENIKFPMKMAKMDKDLQNQRVAQLLADVQLSGFEKRKISELSGGQQQRISLARALANDPEVLLLDEPFSSLDETLRAEMGDFVYNLQQEKQVTTLMITHDKREALKYCSSIALLHNKRIHQQGTPLEMINQPVDQLTADYFGRANYVEGQVIDGTFEADHTDLTLPSNPGQEMDVVAMVRPADVELAFTKPTDQNALTFIHQWQVERIGHQAEYSEIVLKDVQHDLTWHLNLFSHQLNGQVLKEGQMVWTLVDKSKFSLIKKENKGVESR